MLAGFLPSTFPHQIVLWDATLPMCSVDFRNIHMFGENAGWRARLKNGRYVRNSGFDHESVRLDHVSCLDHEEGGGGQHALVMTDWTDCGVSCMSTGVVQVFEVRAAHPVITQQFVFDSHAEGTGATFDEKSLTLTITGRSDDNGKEASLYSGAISVCQHRRHNIRHHARQLAINRHSAH
jgi:hypothetical protein